MRVLKSMLSAAAVCLFSLSLPDDLLVLRSVSAVNSSGVIVRQPLDVFLSNKKQADLFYLSLARIQNNALVNYTNPQSWYALAAIHGTPIAYDGVTPLNPPDDPDTSYGYCNHGDELFPTWHRPYLLALENSIIANARAIIDELPAARQADGYQVADSLRLPYWNWDKIASRSTTLQLPASVTATTQTITNWLATGSSLRIPNPLLKYTVPESAPEPSSVDLSQSVVTRSTGRSFRSGARVISLTNQINQFLANPSWATVSNHNNPRTANIESVHDTLHGLVGGSMAFVATAGYDPIFWLHHNNVDRLFALYQAAQPTSYVNNSTVKRNTLMSKPGDLTSPTSPLWPFQWKHYTHVNVSMPDAPTGPSTFVSSNDIRDTKQWGYSYPELDYLAKKGLTPGTAQYRAELLKFFPRDSTPFTPQATVPPGGARRLLETAARPDEVQWTVDFEKFPCNYFGGSIQVRVFVNLPTANAATSTDNPHTAAILSTFNMRGDYSTEIAGLSESITSAVQDLGILSYSSGAPSVDFQHIRVVITGPAVESWLATATPRQLAQLRTDLSSDLFTPKMKQFALYVQPDGSAKTVPTRYIGVPVTITVAKDRDEKGVASAVVTTQSIDMTGEDLVAPVPTTSTSSASSGNLPIIIGAAAGASVLVVVVAAAILIRRRRAAPVHKATVPTIQMETIQINPVASIQP